jgi:hypothetical protein
LSEKAIQCPSADQSGVVAPLVPGSIPAAAGLTWVTWNRPCPLGRTV